MSTRCEIIINDDLNTVKLYHHSDGYPEGVGADLMKMIDDGKIHANQYAETVANLLIKREEPGSGYQLTFANHTDIEYLYTIELHNHHDGTGRITLKCESGYYAYDDITDRSWWRGEKVEFKHEKYTSIWQTADNMLG